MSAFVSSAFSVCGERKMAAKVLYLATKWAKENTMRWNPKKSFVLWTKDGKAAPSVSRCVGNFQNKINFLLLSQSASNAQTPIRSVSEGFQLLLGERIARAAVEE